MDRPQQPRARYDGPTRSTGSTRSTDVSQFPKHIAGASVGVQVAWLRGQTAGTPTVEIDHDAFMAIDVTVDEAYTWADLSTYEVMFGPLGGYSGRSLLEVLPVDHPAVAAAIAVIRCERYEQELQREAPELMRQIDLAYQAASDEAYAKIAPQMAAYEKMARQLANDPRYVGRPMPIARPEPPDPDLSQARKIEKQKDRLGEEILACRRRRDVALATVSGTLSPLAENLCQLLWIGPGGDPERPDWDEMYRSYERLSEILPDKVEEVWARAEKRWGKG